MRVGASAGMNVGMRCVQKSFVVVGALLVLGACSGLAGEPEIVATLPPRVAIEPTVPVESVDLDVPGAAIFIENCAPCHGNVGRGDGPVVLAGSIQSIPNLADPATMSVQTPQEYFDVITNGRVEKLMPPWRDSLSEAQRWEVTNYVYRLGHPDAVVAESTALVEAVPAPQSTEEGESAAAAPTAVALAGRAVGVVIGEITNATAGGTLPETLVAKLHVIDQDFNETTVEVPVSEGAFRFDDVEFRAEDRYVVTVDYQEMLFVSEIVAGNPAALTRDLSIDIYEPTNEASVVQISSFTSQVSVTDDVLNVFQLVTFTNSSDRAYYQTADGTSVGLTLPEGAQQLDLDSMGRYRLSSDGRTIFDSIPLLPGETHVMHVAYTLPYTGQIEVSQPVQYALSSGYEVLVDDPAIEISGDGLAPLGGRTIGTGVVMSFGTEAAQTAGGSVRFAVSGQPTVAVIAPTTNAPPVLAYVLIGLGAVSIAMASGLYVTNRRQTPPPSAPLENDLQTRMNTLVKEIGALDVQRERNQISAEVHEERRARLKAELMALMQQLKADGK